VETARPASVVSWRVAVVVAGALVYSWVASAWHPFTYPERAAVAIPIVVGGIAVLRMPRRTEEAGPGETRRGIWVWRVLLGLFLVWELFSYLMSPRVDYPTISSMADTIMSVHPGRFAMFAAWLAAGYGLFRS
jgi:hypothetical protein